MAKVNLSRYLALPVSADEAIFRPSQDIKGEPFKIFYYSSNMQPLHGVSTVLAAAIHLQNDPVQFVLVGGKAPLRHAVEVAKKQGANIQYSSWMKISELARTMHESQLCLGGPFGGTRQALNVVTGKTYQSLACGVATVVGEGHATNDLFIDKVNCLKVPQKDVVALTEAVRWAVAAGSDELAKLGAQGRRLYDKEFSNQALATKIRPLIDSIG
jgi:glycosyltransferase involved in cell wall biosynthesis